MAPPMKILAFAGSLRGGSFNRMLLAEAIRRIEGKAEIDRLDLREVAMPMYDGDLEASSGLPPGAAAFKERIAAADGLLIATPEYNNSIPGGLKNAIDWASRGGGNPFRGKVALVVGASPGAAGAARGVLALRQVLQALAVYIVPLPVLVSLADHAFDEAGHLREPRTATQLERACAELLRVTALLKSA